MATEAAKAPVLNGPEDWHDWLDYIKDLATAKRIWNLVDPDLPDVLDLVELEIPSPGDVRTKANDVPKLSEGQRSHLSIL